LKATTINTAVQAAEAGEGKRRINGAPGLYLKVGKNGVGSWVFRYTLKGERHDRGLGTHEAVSLAAARKLAAELIVGRNAGHEPPPTRAEAKAARAARALAEARTVCFRQATEAYVERNAPDWKHRYARQNWIAPIVKYAYPAIGDMALDDIKVADITRALDSAQGSGHRQTDTTKGRRHSRRRGQTRPTQRGLAESG
jgi:hypothetical protein